MSDVCSSDLSKALGSLAIVEGWLGNEEAAIKALRQAVALDPQNSFCHYALGLQLAGVGDYAAARQAQRRALVIDPQNVQAYLALSDLELVQNGDVGARSEEHTSELQSLMRSSYAVF